MTEQRRGHGAQDAGVDLGRSGAEQQARWGIELARQLDHGGALYTTVDGSLKSRLTSRAVATAVPLVAALRAIVGADGVIDHPDALRVYECDGYTLERAAPEIVVLPRATAEVSAVLRLLYRRAIPFVPRGAGTGLSGGTLPLAAPVMVCLSRMQHIEAIDVRNRRIVVQAGVVNQWVSNAVAAHGLHYAPDPSSQPACTIGGNVAENSGGPHTLKYGVTTNHVLGVELVLPTGEVVALGGAVEDRPGYDLIGLVVGAEGTFGIVTRATLRLSRLPQAYRTLLAVFDSVDAASDAVSGIIAEGVVPAALEMMDQLILQAVEAAFHAGLPTGAGAVLLVELDGPAAGLDAQMERVAAVCRTHGVRELRLARDAGERAVLWKCRKRAFGAVGRLAPNYCTQDGVVPRTRVPDILRAIAAAAARHRLRVGNVFHAGDGNIHPILLYDERDAGEVARVLAAGREILEECVRLGGSLTGEHGIGVEKRAQMPLLFNPEDLLAMSRLRAVFDPDGRSNPHKVFPDAKVCVETRAPRRQVPL
jgi:glycolate oxidase